MAAETLAAIRSVLSAPVAQGETHLIEAFIADEEEGPVTGILIDLPNGGQIWSGECSDQTFNDQPEEVRGELGFNSGTLVLRGLPDKSIQVVCKAADVEAGIEIARALARQAPPNLQIPNPSGSVG